MQTEELVKILSTPLFWILSALGSVILGVIGNLATPLVLGIFQAHSQKRQHLERRASAQLLGEILIRFDNPDKLTQTMLGSLYSLLLACVLMLFSLVLFTIAGALEWFLIPIFVRIMISATGIPVLWLALFCTRHGIKFRKIAILVEQRQKTLKKATASMMDHTMTKQEVLDRWDLENTGITMDKAEDALKSKA